MKPLFYGILLLIVALMLTLLLKGGCSGCTNPEETRKTLQNAGYTDIEPGGYSFFACGEDDSYATKFRAVNPRGQTVEGTVCCGLFSKGCTIRW